MQINKTSDRLHPFNPEATTLTVRCRRGQYLASRVAMAIEDCNANVLNIDVTDATDVDTVVVEVRFDHRDTGSVAASLVRYGYETDVEIVAPSADDTDAEVDNPLAALQRYLEI